jgi:hypothetical protein
VEGITLNSRHLKLFACAVAFLAGSGLAAAQKPDYSLTGPVPDAIRNAKSIFVSNAGSDSGLFPEPFSGDPSRPYAELYAGLKANGHYQLVDDPSSADLVLELRLMAPSGPQNPNKQKGASDPLPMVRLTIYDRRSHYVLWAFTESVEVAYLQKTHDRNLDTAIQTILADFENIAGLVTAPPPTQ